MPEKRTRRSVLAAGTAVFCGLTGCASGDIPDSSGSNESEEQRSDWRMHRYNAANTGVNPDASGPTDRVSLTWTYDTKERTHVPTIAENTIYITGSRHVFAVDVHTNTERWSVDVGSTGYRCPAVLDGIVFVPTFEGLFALDAETGAEEWSTHDAGAVSPVGIDDTVYAAQAGSGRVVALATANGDRLWETTVGEGMSILSTPAYADGTLFIATRVKDRDAQQGLVRAIDAQDGSKRWTFQTGGVSFSAPAIHNEALVVPDETGTVYALHPGDGTEMWSTDLGGAFTCPPTVRDGTVYLGSQDGSLYALNLSDGTERWSARGLGFVNTGATVASETVYVEAENGLFAFDAESGDEYWSVQTDMRLYGVIVAGGTIFTGGHKQTQETPSGEYTGRLHAFSA